MEQEMDIPILLGAHIHLIMLIGIMAITQGAIITMVQAGHRLIAAAGKVVIIIAPNVFILVAIPVAPKETMAALTEEIIPAGPAIAVAALAAAVQVEALVAEVVQVAVLAAVAIQVAAVSAVAVAVRVEALVAAAVAIPAVAAGTDKTKHY